MAACFPSVPIRPATGDHDTLLSIDKARRVLGYDPAHSWRQELAVTAGASSRPASRRQD
jgi:UDP-glucose 4-epimerase